jgi:lipopolysaccharide export system protein LptC
MNRPIAVTADPRMMPPAPAPTNLSATTWASARADNGRAFRAARRHSRLVRVLRVGVPVSVVVLLAVIGLMTYFNPLRLLGTLPIDLGNLVVSGTKITMERPRISGFTPDNRAYDLSATAAAQDLTQPDLVELKQLQARIDMQDKSKVEISAISGVYNSKQETLTLRQNIVLTSSTGYAARLSEAVIDVRKGNVVSERPVSVDLLNGTLDANRLEVVDAGERVVFGGGVAMVLTLPNDDASKANRDSAGDANRAAPR